jgi:predicted ArsR family transcriptional regulator
MAIDPGPPERSDVTDLTAILDLLRKPKLMELYVALHDESAAIPDVLPQLSLGKTAAYEYCDRLEAAGLVTAVGTESNSTVYESRDFSMTIRIESEEITVTPSLARVLAERSENPEVDRFVDQYGVETLAEFVPLARQYAEGAATHRSIAEQLDVSRAAAFEMLGDVLDILGITPEAAHSGPEDFGDEEAATIVEDARPTE